MTGNKDSKETVETVQRSEKILIVVCVALAMAGAAWFYLSSDKASKVTPLENPSGKTAQNENAGEAQNATKIMVHVAGNVNNPGVYELPYGSRVKDALDAAGGANADADVNALNLVEVVTDGQKITVPSKVSTVTIGSLAQSPGAVDSAGGAVNINTADEKTLEELPGVGPELAKRIIEYRAQQTFTSVEELKNVSGIGDKKFEKIKDRITLY